MDCPAHLVRISLHVTVLSLTAQTPSAIQEFGCQICGHRNPTRLAECCLQLNEFLVASSWVVTRVFCRSLGDTSSNSPDLIPTFDLWLAKEHGSRGSQAGISPSSNDFGLFPGRHRSQTITETVLLASSSGISSVVKGIWESCDLFRIIISHHWGSRWQTWSLWNTLNIARCLTSDCKFNSHASIFKIKFLEILKIFFHKN